MIRIKRKQALGRVIGDRLYLSIHRRRARANTGRHPKLAVFASDRMAAEINLRGVHELDLLADIDTFLRHRKRPLRGTVIDVGARIGNHTVFFAERAERVIAFEPDPQAFDLLAFNTRDLPVEPHRIALGEAHAPAAAETAEMQRLDDLTAASGETIALVRIDVGAEALPALKGAEAMMMRHRPVVLLRLPPSAFAGGSSPALDQLRRLNYEFYVRTTNLSLGRGWRTVAGLLRAAFGETVRFRKTVWFRRADHGLIVAMPMSLAPAPIY